MTLGIYTIEKTLFEGEVSEIVAETETGEITILPQHAPLVTRLKRAPIRILRTQGKEEKIDIESGFLEVQPESKVVVLVDAQ